LSDSTIPSRFPDEARAALALTLVADVGSVTHRRLIERFGTASRALDEGVSREIASAAFVQADALMTRGAARRLALTTIVDPGYPAQLRDLHDPPAVLWSHGHWSTLQPPVVAVVGTRRASAYGLRIARALVTGLARAGACIVSGMATGIDAVAHRSTLEADGRTVAVLGTGADVAYPRSHHALHSEICSRGLVLSELRPEAQADGGSFPRRNRIIAALASLTIVVEAPRQSGALNTARHALDLGRDVAAVPGAIDAPQSEGSNGLIQQGAHVVTSVADALSLVGLDPPIRLCPVLNDECERCVWQLLEQGSATLDELCGRTALPVTECLSAVTRLELRGIVECALTGEIRRR
jgi:DNA processing protein